MVMEVMALGPPIASSPMLATYIKCSGQGNINAEQSRTEIPFEFADLTTEFKTHHMKEVAIARLYPLILRPTLKDYTSCCGTLTVPRAC